jgi:mannitol/fructose-specific phosphotransferase system IIA component (Ntr-type)
MNLSDVLSLDRVSVLPSMDKADALKAMIKQLSETPQVQDREALEEGIFHRETLMSTGIGMGIGVPHVRLPSVKDPVMAAALFQGPVLEYESLDGEDVRLIFMIAAGKDQHAEHLRLLSFISSRLRDQTLRDALVGALEAEAFYHMLMTGEVA